MTGTETLAALRVSGVVVRDTPAERMRAEAVTGTIFLNMIDADDGRFRGTSLFVCSE